MAREYNQKMKNDNENKYVLSSIDIIYMQLDILCKVPCRSNTIKILSYIKELKRSSLELLKKHKTKIDVPSHLIINWIYNSATAKERFVSSQIELFINIDNIGNSNVDVTLLLNREIRSFSLIPFIKF
ncbi:MAG: hypothetical protein LBF12_05165 [Christensenellaceae bacterium]|nr:hypothetical protein [Christensenellaceae bacterium]